MLASVVPEVPGTMCMFGVTKVMTKTTLLIQVAMPVSVLVFGAWMLLDYARRRSGEAIRRARGMVALALVAGLVAGTSATEVYYVTNMKSLNKVSCCSSFAREARARLQAPSYYLPWELPAQTRRWILGTAFFGGAALLVLWLLAKPVPGGGRRRAGRYRIRVSCRRRAGRAGVEPSDPARRALLPAASVRRRAGSRLASVESHPFGIFRRCRAAGAAAPALRLCRRAPVRAGAVGAG